MAEYRILTENDKIDALIESFEDSLLGMGLKVLCNITIEKGKDASTMVLKTKDPEKEITAAEFFTLGLMIQRDYLGIKEKEEIIKLKNVIYKIKSVAHSLD